MKQLFQIDCKDYKETDRHSRRPSVRGIIITKEKKIALVYSTKEHYYKFPGGGINDQEDHIGTLIREVKEETGLTVIPQSVREYGSVLRLQKSDDYEDTVFEQENFYYFCEVTDECGAQNLDEYEKAAGFELRIVSLQEAIEANSQSTENRFNQVMRERERRVLELLQVSLEVRYLPDKISFLVKGKNYEQNEVGMSDSDVYMFTDMVLKIQKQTEETKNEEAVIKWISEHSDKLLSEKFPKILCYTVEDGYAYTLMTRVGGEMLCQKELMEDPKRLVRIAAEGLKLLWQLDVSGCPLTTSRLEQRLKAARYNVEHGLVDMENVESDNFGEIGFQNPEELINWLESHKPEEDLVFTHGDYCLPNIFTDKETIEGFIDLGKAGPADKWQDIAVGLRSLQSNFDGRYTDGIGYPGYDPKMFLKELGIELDEEKYRYYLLLDELF